MADLLFNIYLASFVFGGILVGASLFFGGKDVGDADSEFGPAGVDLDGAVAELAADGLGVDVDGVDVDGVDKGIAVGGETILPWFLTSFRFWVYFLAFFGLSGVLFSMLLGAIPTLALSLGLGTSAGLFVAGLIKKFENNTAARSKGAADFIGKSAQVLVAPKNGTGQIRVRVGKQLVDVLAVTDDDVQKGDEVLVIEMEGTRARIAKMDLD